MSVIFLYSVLLKMAGSSEKVEVDIVRDNVFGRFNDWRFDGRRLDKYRLDVRKRKGVRAVRRVSISYDVSYEINAQAFIRRAEWTL